MGFYAKSFTYNGEMSEYYNLQIASMDSGGATSNNGSGSIDIIDDFIFRNPVPYFYGVKYNSKLSFPVAFFSPDEVTAVDISYIQQWLFGDLQYRNLAIVQPDMDGIYFKCIFTDPQIIKAGNLIRGISGTAICNSQWAFTYPRTITYEYGSAPSDTEIRFFNNSHYKGYNRPIVSFKMDSSGGDLSVVNESDDSREFLFESLSARETITTNSSLGQVQSDLGLRRLSNFNKNFLRLKNGLNVLKVTGNISELSITYEFVRRLGG